MDNKGMNLQKSADTQENADATLNELGNTLNRLRERYNPLAKLPASVRENFVAVFGGMMMGSLEDGVSDRISEEDFYDVVATAVSVFTAMLRQHEVAINGKSQEQASESVAKFFEYVNERVENKQDVITKA